MLIFVICIERGNPKTSEVKKRKAKENIFINIGCTRLLRPFNIQGITWLLRLGKLLNLALRPSTLKFAVTFSTVFTFSGNTNAFMTPSPRFEPRKHRLEASAGSHVPTVTGFFTFLLLFVCCQKRIVT